MTLFLVLSVIPFSAMAVSHIGKRDSLLSSSPHISRFFFSSVELIPNLSSQVSTTRALSRDDSGVTTFLIKASKAFVGAVSSVPVFGIDLVVVCRDGRI